jgi:hypothetical protein
MLRRAFQADTLPPSPERIFFRGLEETYPSRSRFHTPFLGGEPEELKSSREPIAQLLGVYLPDQRFSASRTGIWLPTATRL